MKYKEERWGEKGEDFCLQQISKVRLTVTIRREGVGELGERKGGDTEPGRRKNSFEKISSLKLRKGTA